MFCGLVLFASSRHRGMYSSNGTLGLETLSGKFPLGFFVLYSLPFTYFYCKLVWEALFQNFFFIYKWAGGIFFYGSGLFYSVLFFFWEGTL